MNSPTQSYPAVYEGTFSEGTFLGANGLKLFYRSRYPTGDRYHSGGHDTAEPVDADRPISKPIKGVVAIVHGLGEHSGRYRTVFDALVAAGYAVFSFDNQGHGQSEGQRGHITAWQDYRDNTHAFLTLIREKEPMAPLFLMGHSLGGLIVLDYILRQSSNSLAIAGLVVSAPPIQPVSGTVSKPRVMIAQLLSGLFPRFSMKMKLNCGGLSRSQQVTDETKQDPLTHPYVTLRWGSETLNTIEWVRSHVQNIQLPILLTHGSADPIMDYQGTCNIFEQVGSTHKALKIYEGSYHEPHNDLDADVVTRDLVSWLDESLATAGCVN